MIRQSTETRTIDRSMKHLFIVRVTKVIDAGRVEAERILPNGKQTLETYFFSDASECTPGTTMLDVKPILNGHSQAFLILGETPASIAARYLEDAKKWQAAAAQ